MILRYCICIPTFNNPETIEAVVRDCLERTEYPILVVDDGSHKPVEDVWRNSRVAVLRSPANQGKGVALQRAMKEGVARGFTHMIALDADGQHLASEVSKLVAVSLGHPWDLIIGSRKMGSENVPGVSKFGRNFSNFWVKFQTSCPITDSQSGFRIYPLFSVQNLRFWTKKFDFEIEVLIRMLWNGVGVREVEVECFYPPPEERVSHFDKLWDNVRISCLNTVLVVLSLLRERRSPREIAFAVGAGVWIGCTPLFGFHALMAGGAAFLFRLNAVYLFLGTQISIPPLAPLLAVVSIAVGNRLTGMSSGSAGAFSWNWLLGSMVLGAVLGIFFGLASFFFVQSIQAGRPAEKAQWNGRTRGGRFGNGFLKTLTRYGGLRATYAFLYLVVPYFYFFAPKARRSSSEYWATVRPDESWLRRQARVLSHFYRFAQTLIDRVYQGFREEQCFAIRSNGMENILDPVRAGRGLIMMTAHVGSWDLAAAALRSDGLAKQFHMVKYESQGITFDKARNQADPEHVKKLIANEAQQPVLQIRGVLARGLPVGLMGDRPLGNHFELVSFFGKLAPVDCTPFRIAAACGVPLLFTFGFKGEGRTYDFYATPARKYSYAPEIDKAVQISGWAQEFARELERFVRKYPEQWFNFFPFWSAIPAPPEDVGAARARNHSVEQSREPTTERAASAPGSLPNAGSGSQPSATPVQSSRSAASSS